MARNYSKWVVKGKPNYELGRKITSELLEELLDKSGDFAWKEEDIPNKLTSRLATSIKVPSGHSVEKMLKNIYHNSISSAVMDAKPYLKWENLDGEIEFVKLRPYDFKNPPKNLWFKGNFYSNTYYVSLNLEMIAECVKEQAYSLNRKYGFETEILPCMHECYFKEKIMPFGRSAWPAIEQIGGSKNRALYLAFPEIFEKDKHLIH